MNNNEIRESFNMTDLGLLPEGWVVVRLVDVTEKTKQKNPRKTPEWRFKYVDVSSISRDALKIAECKLCQGKDAPSRAKKLVKRNDVIFATVRPTLKRLTLIDEEFDGEICSTAFCILRATEHILNPLYLFYAVQRDVFIDEFEKVQRGASYPAITDSDVKNQSIPLPPLPEQHRIAAVLSAVQDAKEKTGAVIAAAKSLKKSLMRHLFTYGPVPAGAAERVPLAETEIGLVPEGWGECKIRDCCNLLTGGTPNTKLKEYWHPPEIPWMKSGEIQGNKIISISTFISEKGLENSNARWLPKESVVIALAGRGKTRGTTAPLEFDCTCNQSVVCMKPNEKVSYLYLHYYLTKLYPYIRMLTGDKDRSGLNKQIMGNIPLFYPPPPIQQKIAHILSTVDKKIGAEENKKIALDELFKSLLHNLMTGKIRVNHLEMTQ